MDHKENIFKVSGLVGILLALFLLVITIKEVKSIGYVGRDVAIMNSISVNGKGEEMATPDIATFSFGVTEKAKTVKEAQDTASKKLNAAIDVIKKGGVAEKDIKTTSYNINPSYEYQGTVCTAYGCPPGKSVLTGYEVSQTVQIKVRDISKAGDLLVSIGSLEVQNISGLSFSVDDIDGVTAKARASAIADAKTKAEKLVSDLGVRIVRITSFYDNSNQPSPYYGMGGDMMSAKVSSVAVAPELPAGEQKVVANVTITYEIR